MMSQDNAYLAEARRSAKQHANPLFALLLQTYDAASLTGVLLTDETALAI